MTSAVQLSSVIFSYPNSNAVFECNDWTLNHGEHVFLQGPSGSGKSTLLGLLSGILKPNSGEVCINGTELSRLSQKQRDKFRAQNLGVVFQQFNLVPYLNTLENLQLATHFANSELDIEGHVKPMLEALKLDESVLTQAISTLSIGQKQRVAIMRACVNTPKVLLVDEPTSALDSQAANGFMGLLLDLCKVNQSSLIFVSHDDSLGSYFERHETLSNIATWSSVDG
ncbi:ATP-binding cassette domain-containing protein [Alteromonas sp. 5E99-2]|uniref:ABC transporter ATP-binding protein n=1 Tax=Alteromonas sp. 5E99-2 TaxID=2817683 RepID=UPI001A9932F6|nr:ATP-binding cassette domain-containing protein [Alteromonas sp. 5E99-2]MBO1254423.1 ATP-binding cassette domain-containing protein [Alteromonas sp. 5E99-2]